MLFFTASVTTQAQVSIETVRVGDAGNAGNSNDSNFGAVDYEYNIGKYEVTNSQYAAFLNAVAATDTRSLYSTVMNSDPVGGITRSGSSGSYSYAVKSGFENMPVVHVSFWDAARFANWVNNGQGSASTETGSYTLTSSSITANTVTRNVSANWVIANENEWYKAAYYDPTREVNDTGPYWSQATRSDSLADNTDFAATNGANYEDGDYANGGEDGPGFTAVGAYSNAVSYYGTYDQGGNAAEWNETRVSSNSRGLRGGSFGDPALSLSASSRFENPAAIQVMSYGFRLVSLSTIPEPSATGFFVGAFALAGVMMRRKSLRNSFL